MSKERIASILTAWLPAVEGYKFTTSDVQKPALLKRKAHKVAHLIRENFPTINFEESDRGAGKEEQ